MSLHHRHRSGSTVYSETRSARNRERNIRRQELSRQREQLVIEQRQGNSRRPILASVAVPLSQFPLLTLRLTCVLN